MKTVANGRITAGQDALRQRQGVSVYWFAKFEWRSGTQYYALRDFVPDPAVSVKPIILNYPTIDRAMPVGLGNQGMSNAASITLMNLPQDLNRIEILLETNSECIVGTQVTLYLAYEPVGALAEADWILENIYRIQGHRTGTNTVTFDLVDWVLGKGGAPATNVVTETLFPYAAEEVVGTTMPHVFGSLENVPLLPIDIGPTTQLDGAITAEATTIWIDGPLNNVKWPVEGGGRIQVGDEQIDFNGIDFVEMKLEECERGVNTTAAIEHSDRSTVRLIRRASSDILASFLVADHECNAITNLRIGGQLVAVGDWNEGTNVDIDGRTRHYVTLANAAVPTYQAPSGSATTDKFAGTDYWENNGSSPWVDWGYAIDEEPISTGCAIKNQANVRTLGLGFYQDLSSRGTAIKNARLVVEYSILTTLIEDPPEGDSPISWPWPKVHLERTGLDTQVWDLPKPSDEELRAKLERLAPATDIKVPGFWTDETSYLFKSTEFFRLGPEHLTITDGWVLHPAGAYPNTIIPYVMDGQFNTVCPWEIKWWDFTDITPEHPWGAVTTTHIYAIGLTVTTLPDLGPEIRSVKILALKGDDYAGFSGHWEQTQFWDPPITSSDFIGLWLGMNVSVGMPIAGNRSIREIWGEIEYTRQRFPGATHNIESETDAISNANARTSAINLTKEFDITEIVRTNGEWDYFDNTVRLAIHHSTSDPADESPTEILIKDVRIEIDHLAEETQIGTGQVTADVDGRQSGAALLETPKEIIQELITAADYFGINIAYFDTDSIDAALAILGTADLNFARVLRESTSARQLLYQAAECAGLRVAWDAGMFRFSPIGPVSLLDVEASGYGAVRNELWTAVAKDPLNTDLAANRLDLKFMKWNMTPGIVQVPDPESDVLTPSQELPWGILPKELTMPWLKIVEQVQQVGSILLREVEFPRTRIRVTSSLGWSHMELGDPMSITDEDSRLSSGVAGRLCGVKYEGNNKTSIAMLAGSGRVVVWEDPVDPDNYYIELVLGSGYMNFVVAGNVVARLTSSAEWRIKRDYVEDIGAPHVQTDYIEKVGLNIGFGLEDPPYIPGSDIITRMYLNATGDMYVLGVVNWSLFGTIIAAGSWPTYIEKAGPPPAPFANGIVFSNNGIYAFSTIHIDIVGSVAPAGSGFLGCRDVQTNVEF